MRSIPERVDSGCPELDIAWANHAAAILDERGGVLIPDTDEDLTWHAFLGHSVDQQGFRAGEFTGVDGLSRSAPRFGSLIELHIGVRELAELWHLDQLREHLLWVTQSMENSRSAPVRTTLEDLRRAARRGGH